MKRRQHPKKGFRYTLLVVWGILLCIISFEIGGRLAKAQIIYFDEPLPTQKEVSQNTFNSQTLKNTDISTLTKRPATAQYQEFKDQISTTVTPENPGPNQTVTISVSVYSFDINISTITWKVNGKVQKTAIGAKDFSFTTGSRGETTTVVVEIDPKDRPILTKEFTFKPGEVDILWQSQVYTPPFYRGKKMYTPESNLIFMAMPQNKNGIVTPHTSAYMWTINNNKQANKSGFGVSSYFFEGPIIFRPVQVAVEAYTSNTSDTKIKEVSTDEIRIEPRSSGLLFYENNPLYGVLFNKALRGSFTITQEEMGISAYPYFQTAQNKNTDLIYSWAVDSYMVPIAENQNTITLRKVKSNSGQSIVAAKSYNPLKILQTADTSLFVSFDKSIQTARSKELDIQEGGFGN